MKVRLKFLDLKYGTKIDGSIPKSHHHGNFQEKTQHKKEQARGEKLPRQ